MAAWPKPILSGDAAQDALISEYWKPWTVSTWFQRWPKGYSTGVKLGPLAVYAYTWFDGKLRLSYSWRAGMERIVLGGPLT